MNQSPRRASAFSPGRIDALRSAQARRGEAPILTRAQGDLVAALAVSKPGGLLLANGTGELALWIAEAMSITTRLVALVEPPGSAAAALLGDDLRIAVHHQDLRQFLADVAEHRFDLVALESAPADDALVDLLLDRAAAGGFLACPAPAKDLERLEASLQRRPGVHTARVAGPRELLLASCGPAHSEPRRRGGRTGRRARRDGEG